MEEIWRDIEGYEGLYKVSSEGNVKSLQREDSRGCPIEEKLLKQSNDKRHYKIVGLNKDNKRCPAKVSRLVAKAFPEICGEWFEGCEVHHIDQNHSNNSAINLKVVSKGEHIQIHTTPKKDKFKWWRDLYL